jgi:hypothetical protein
MRAQQHDGALGDTEIGSPMHIYLLSMDTAEMCR